MPFSDLKKMQKGKMKPLVYSCSGCSSAAQMANYIAIKLDRLKIAEMSCIAGVGGGVRSLVKVAKSSRPIVAIDGCPLACVKACLKMHDVNPDDHIILSDLGVKKNNGIDFDMNEAKNILKQILNAAHNNSEKA